MSSADRNRSIAAALTPSQRDDLLADVIAVHRTGNLSAYGIKVEWNSIQPVNRLLDEQKRPKPPKLWYVKRSPKKGEQYIWANKIVTATDDYNPTDIYPVIVLDV